MKPEKDHIPSAPRQPLFCAMGPYDSSFDNLKTESFDPGALWERVNRDLELLRELVELFSDQYPALLKNVEAAIQQRSFADVQKFSHKIKGSLLQFSATRAAATAARLETLGKNQSLEDAGQMLSELREEIAGLMKALHLMIQRKKSVV